MNDIKTDFVQSLNYSESPDACATPAPRTAVHAVWCRPRHDACPVHAARGCRAVQDARQTWPFQTDRSNPESHHAQRRVRWSTRVSPTPGCTGYPASLSTAAVYEATRTRRADRRFHGAATSSAACQTERLHAMCH